MKSNLFACEKSIQKIMYEKSKLMLQTATPCWQCRAHLAGNADSARSVSLTAVGGEVVGVRHQARRAAPATSVGTDNKKVEIASELCKV